MAFRDSFFHRYIKFVRMHIPIAESLRHLLFVAPYALYGFVGIRNAPKNLPLKIVPGASGVFSKGWYPLEYPFFNLLKMSSWQKWLGAKKAKAILMEHVLEHFEEQAIFEILVNCKQFLDSGGVVRIAVPDGYNPSKEYIEYVKPGGFGIGSESHEVLLTYKTIKSIIERAGLECSLIEYYDEHGQFTKNTCDAKYGKIKRDSLAKHHMKLPENYTSLIVDAIRKD